MYNYYCVKLYFNGPFIQNLVLYKNKVTCKVVVIFYDMYKTRSIVMHEMPKRA